MTIPTAAAYKSKLSTLDSSNKIASIQRTMLGAHYWNHNRTITYTELAKAAGYDSNDVANLQYGLLGKILGRELNFPFTDLDSNNPGVKFQSSAIGMGVPSEYSSGNEFELVMHHELAKALDELGWFPKEPFGT